MHKPRLKSRGHTASTKPVIFALHYVETLRFPLYYVPWQTSIVNALRGIVTVMVTVIANSAWWWRAELSSELLRIFNFVNKSQVRLVGPMQVTSG